MARPADLKYLKSHEWARHSGPVVEVGITDHAVEMLNHEIVFVDLPKVGRKVRQGESFGAIESVKAASDLYAPVTGTVAEVNGALDSNPNLVSEGPFSSGWMIRITPDDVTELDTLLDVRTYDILAAEDTH